MEEKKVGIYPEIERFHQVIERIVDSVYVADQMLRVERKCLYNRKEQLRILTAIAHKVGLFNCTDRLLTQDEEVKTRRFLTIFSLTKKGRNALAIARKFPRWRTAA